jgi:hypothetical protein
LILVRLGFGLDFAASVLGNIRAVWLHDMFLPSDAFDWPLNVVVVRTGGRTILIDAGIGADYPDCKPPASILHP